MRFRLPLTCAAAAMLPSWSSIAAERPMDPTASDTVSVEASSGLAWIKNQSRYEPLYPYVYGQFAPSYRVSRVLSLGGLVGYMRPLEGGMRLWRFSGEARVHAVRTRTFDAWASGEIGFAVSTFVPAASCAIGGASGGTTGANDCGNPADLTTHVEPVLGGAIGLEVLPVPYVSIGFGARALVVVFGSATDTVAPSGASPAIFAGLTLGFHVPLQTP